MIRASFAAVALFFLVGQCVADTVLGGMVDYLPKCFDHGQGDFMMFIEYNNVLMDGVRTEIYILEHKTLEGLYGVATDDMLASRYVPPDKAERYITNTVLQPFNVRNKADTKYLGISLKAGIRMIRFRYIPNVFQPDWMRGVQVRFTLNMVSKIQVVENGVPDKVAYSDDFGFKSAGQTLGIDLECFMGVGSIQQENRLGDYQLESCFYLVAANYTRYYGAFKNENDMYSENWMVKNPIELAACEQKAKVIAPPPPEEDPLFSALKFIVTSAVGFIPVFGPVLAFGVGAAFELAESQEKYNKYMIDGAGNYAVSKAQEDWPKLKKVLSKVRRR